MKFFAKISPEHRMYPLLLLVQRICLLYLVLYLVFSDELSKNIPTYVLYGSVALAVISVISGSLMLGETHLPTKNKRRIGE
jgi:hypothetical protein